MTELLTLWKNKINSKNISILFEYFYFFVCDCTVYLIFIGIFCAIAVQ